MYFESPHAFFLLLIIPLVLVLRMHFGRRRGTVRFSTTRNAAQAGRSLRQRLAVLPLLLQVLALVSLTVALARPQEGKERVRDVSKGIAIEMVIDRSGSMGAEMEFKHEKLNRLEVVKRVFEEFVLGKEGELPGRPNDLIGMIVFARYADTICPLTLAHGALSRFVDRVELVKRREEDGTSIGDAIALAAARLKTAEESLAKQMRKKTGDYEIKSKIMILLTDGENNAGKRDPRAAAKLAREWGIKIYTIGVGGGESVTTIQTPFGAYKVPMGRTIDEDTLKDIAELTGGIYRRAETAESLVSIYEEIDKLERSEVESIRYVDYRETFMPWALLALILLLAATVLNNTVFRKIP